MRYFVFLTLEDKILQNFLNIAIYALNPFEKWDAHITLAGPFSSSKNLPKDLEFNQKISILGAGQFRSNRQNTVHLKVGATDLKSVWNKPDYPYNPHLTIYDGDDHELGDDLYIEINKIRPFMKFYVSKLTVVSSIKGQGKFTFLPDLDFTALFSTVRFSEHDLFNLTKNEKISIAAEAILKAKSYSMKYG